MSHLSFPRLSRTPMLLAAALGAVCAGAGAARAQAPVVNGNMVVQTVPCGDGDATVNGSDNRVAFTGTCRGLAVDGDNNRIQIDLVPGARVAIAGHGNRVAYTRSPSGDGPNLALDGADNEVVARTQPPTGALAGAVTVTRVPGPPVMVVPVAPGMGPLLLAANQDRETIDCTGRDVLIRGSESQYRLLGGCRSITDEGGGDLIDAQLQPGAHVVISGPGDMVRYALIGPGPAPVVSVTASNSSATEVDEVAVDGPPVIVAQPR